MKSIIAKNNLSYIGLNNKLLWKSKEDLKHFKSLTLNGRLLVGYNTFQELPLLKDRTIILDIRNELITDVEWCIGGKKTYEKYCHLFTELHISHINDETEGDTFEPDFRNLNPNCRIYHYYFDVD